ncbi:hypothetical protein AZE42_10047 [Rhizopogon vesiculosus]|uniref:Protein-S-isoprenylcysteine O-methyltransferase n=1 Tax=Rhizopogon vesiculosus TaxID=180088 RepID=A0A1J8R0A2_9AGAM|nr:hypothetical protein AZE42_10047 [Rhizopogon vesiculosus]
MSLLKIPLLLSSAIAAQVASTAPNKPSSNEIVHQTFIGWISMKDLKWGLPLTKANTWAICLGEIAITVAHMIDPDALPSVMQPAVGLLRQIEDMPITSPFLLGTALAVTGGFIRWWCFRTLGRFFTFKLSVRKGHKLVTSGPYAIVRHPSYMGGIILYIGRVICFTSSTALLRRSGFLNIPAMATIVWAWRVWRTLALFSYLGRINQEDEVLKSLAGEEWENWAKVVRYKLLPGVY